MSLNGLDAQQVTDALSFAIAEPAGWFLLKYTSRDTVDLLATGNRGVTEARTTASQYDAKSPLYGLLMFRRKRVLIKFIPKGTSRVLQARTTVHFPTLTERYAPHDAVLDITSAEELSDTSLAAVFPLHTGASATSTPKLDEIMEDADDDDGEPSLARPPLQSRSPSGTSTMSRKAVLARKSMRYKRLPSLPDPSSDTATVSETDDSQTISISQYLVEEEQDGSQSVTSLESPSTKIVEPLAFDSTERLSHHLDPVEFTKSSQSLVSLGTTKETHSSPDSKPASRSSDKNDAYLYNVEFYRPKITLGPRPVLVSAKNARGSHTAGAANRSTASLPTSLRSRHRSVDAVTSTLDVASLSAASVSSHDSFPTPPRVTNDTHPMQHRSASSQSYASMTSASLTRKKTGLSPEKQRLMKALEMRKKQMSKSHQLAETATLPEPSTSSTSSTSIPAPTDEEASRMNSLQFLSVDTATSDTTVPPNEASFKKETDTKADFAGKVVPVDDQVIGRQAVEDFQAPLNACPDLQSVAESVDDTATITELPKQSAQDQIKVTSDDVESSIRPESTHVPAPLVADDKSADIYLPAKEFVSRPASTALTENSARKSDSGIQLECKEFDTPESPSQVTQADRPVDLGHADSPLAQVDQPSRPPSNPVSSSTVGEEANATFIDETAAARPSSQSGNARPQSVESREPDSPQDSTQRSDGSKRKRRGFVLPVDVSNSEGSLRSDRCSGETYDSDLINAFDSATVHEATIAVQSSPCATFLRRTFSGRSAVTMAGRAGASDSSLTHYKPTSHNSLNKDLDNASFGDLLVPVGAYDALNSSLSRSALPSVAGERSNLIGSSRRVFVKPGISERIAKLEEIRLSQSACNALPPLITSSPNSDPTRAERKVTRKSLSFQGRDAEGDSMKDRIKAIGMLTSIRSSSVRDSVSSFQSYQTVQSRTGPVMQHTTVPPSQEIVSVTARIVRADDSPPVVPPKDQDYTESVLHAPNITIDRKRATWTSLSTLDGLGLAPAGQKQSHSEDNSPKSPTHSNFSTEKENRRLSFGNLAEDDIDSHRAPSRTSRFMKRMSALGSNGSSRAWKGFYALTGPPSLKSRPGSKASSPTKAYGDGLPSTLEHLSEPLPAITLGSMNVQFPDSVLWKRRSLEIDSTGLLVVTASKFHALTKRYYLHDFDNVYIPDMDAQELAHSIFLRVKNGGGILQCACEGSAVQQKTLQVLLEYHAFWRTEG